MMKTYKNPIRRGMYPDPSIVNVNGIFYMVNSTFEYYPGISLARSKDLLNWETLPGIIQSPSQADLRKSASNEGIFATCIRYYNKHFYVITTNFAEFKTFIIRGILMNDSIKWDKKRIEIDIPGIDPDLFFENGKAYVQFTGYIDDKGTKAIRQVEIDIETGKIINGPKILSFGSGGRDVEGPHIIKNKDKYYLLLAEGGTGLGHMITMFVSDSIWGPYTEDSGINPIFTNRDRANEQIQNVGHADLFQDQKGSWWLTCLGTRPASVGFSQITNIGRETLLYPVDWTGKWPKVYQGIPTVDVDLDKFPIQRQTLPDHQKDSEFCDSFESGRIKPDWLSLRDNLGDRQLIENKTLILKGSTHTLDKIGTPTFLGVRQAEHNEKMVLTLDSNKTELNNGQVGLVTVINIDHFAGIMLSKASDDKFAIHHLQQVGDVKIDKIIGYLDELPTSLSVYSSNESKTYQVTDSDNKVEFTVSALNLSNEAIAALNTGDIQGPYVIGNAVLGIKKVIRVPDK